MKLSEASEETMKEIYGEWLDSNPKCKGVDEATDELDNFLEQSLPKDQYIEADTLSGNLMAYTQHQAFCAGFEFGVRYKALITEIGG